MDDKEKQKQVITAKNKKESKLPHLKKYPTANIAQNNNCNDENNIPSASDSNLSVRHSFQKSLSKLYMSDTRERGMKEIGELLKKNNSSDHLGIYLSTLSDSKKVNQVSGKESEILMIAYLCEVYGVNLIDTREPSSSLVKTVSRVIDLVFSNFIACSRALIAINNFCLKGQSPEKRKDLTIKAISNLLLSGIDKSSQHSAAVVFYEFLQSLVWNKDMELLEAGSSEIIATFMKVPLESMYFEMVASARSVLENLSSDKIKAKLKFTSILKKLLSILNNKKQGFNNLNNYMLKVEALMTLGTLSKHFVSLNDEDDKDLLEVLIVDLDRSSRDRVVQVQIFAKKTLREWIKAIESDSCLKQRCEGNSQVQAILGRFKDVLTTDETKTEKGQRDSKLPMNADIFNVVERSGWSAHIRGQKFVKKGSGVGGGYFKSDKSKSRSPIPTENPSSVTSKKQEKIREFIINSKSKARANPKEHYFVLEENENGMPFRKRSWLRKTYQEENRKVTTLILTQAQISITEKWMKSLLI